MYIRNGVFLDVINQDVIPGVGGGAGTFSRDLIKRSPHSAGLIPGLCK